MAFDRLENCSIGQERKQAAEAVPQTVVDFIAPEQELRIPAHDLFTLFTATIILQNELFIR